MATTKRRSARSSGCSSIGPIWRVKYELGSLYFRLGSYEMARRYFREALACPDIDPATKDRIEASLPDADKQMQQSRLSAFVQTGLRYQSNASYAPTSGTVRLGGQDLALLPSATRKSDTNWFALAGVSHDYDLDDQRGDTLETRFPVGSRLTLGPDF